MTTLLDRGRWEKFLHSFDQPHPMNDLLTASTSPIPGWNQIAESGLFSTFDEYGIEGHGMQEAVNRMRALGRKSSDRGLSFSAVTQMASTIYCIRAFGSDAIKRKYLAQAESGEAIGGHAITESEAGSDVKGMATTATLSGDHYVLNGTKKFITNAPTAATLVVYAHTIEEGIDKGISAFMVDTRWPGVDTTVAMDTAGLRSSPIGEVTLTSVPVPAENKVGHTGAGMLILDQVMKREILLAFAVNIGEMERIVAMTVKYANTRRQFDANIGSNQLVSNRIVETQIAIELGGSLLDSITRRLDGFDDVTVPIAAAKIFISEANVDSVLNAISVHGGNGYLTESPLPENLLDAIPGAIYSGSNDVLRAKVATMLGVHT